MASISNGVLSVAVSEKGTELQSVYNQRQQIEYMWSADPAVWAKKSPVLFPIVGELKDKKYSYRGKEYHLSRHGFARDMRFELADEAADSLTFSIYSTEETLAVFPFHFRFSVKYVLKDNILTITYLVENTGEKHMYFSVGGHPAFKVPITAETVLEDYALIFEKPETAGRYPLSKDGLLETTAEPLLNNTTTLPLKRELFVADAIVFKKLASTSVAIVSNKTAHQIKVDFAGFPYLGIWQAPGGDFVCIEPWCGIADSVKATGKLEEKEGINVLEPGKTFIASFSVEFS